MPWTNALAYFASLSMRKKFNSTDIELLVPSILKTYHKVKAGLHYGDYRAKLVHFEAQKIFSISKKP